MADNDLDVYLTARNVLVEMRLNLAKAVSAGYKKGETETAVKSLIEVQQAIDVIDHASEELEELDEGEHDED
ncbi:hypothetical protein SSBR45G_69320 [Bradyrhizobium sp. SSBR45G]|uniref:hypothetical protein n=1 Tax=unclassified Bradyrhizobium TaxID=2631580 RepID=UPI002342A416|nr:MULTISPECIES: hypothetical protein [unclassified Bradyrhizobium]GLH82023.1 hypothetical protein SSBR45G_69320 [Bradyrhizobium sp. SSBR45G]GLH85395.1 hypothetical protein SSBR45R_28550 [Bradyrhizobium sp. SSBR45R]